MTFKTRRASPQHTLGIAVITTNRGIKLTSIRQNFLFRKPFVDFGGQSRSADKTRTVGENAPQTAACKEQKVKRYTLPLLTPFRLHPLAHQQICQQEIELLVNIARFQRVNLEQIRAFANPITPLSQRLTRKNVDAGIFLVNRWQILRTQQNRRIVIDGARQTIPQTGLQAGDRKSESYAGYWLRKV